MHNKTTRFFTQNSNKEIMLNRRQEIKGSEESSIGHKRHIDKKNKKGYLLMVVLLSF